MSEAFQQRAEELITLGAWLYARGSVPATSGNLSARLPDGTLAITVSGRHKGRLTPDDIMRVDPEGRPLDAGKPSAETLLHTRIYRQCSDAAYVVHPHAPGATVLSMELKGDLRLTGYELLKAFAGIDSHTAELVVPVFDNDQNIPRLCDKVDRAFEACRGLHGYLIRGHGYYTWGATTEEVTRYVEALEFLFDCEWRRGAPLLTQSQEAE